MAKVNAELQPARCNGRIYEVSAVGKDYIKVIAEARVELDCETELAEHYNERVVLQRDNVKDEGGYRAVFAEQSTSASQVAAAKFLDTISKSSSMSGHASGAVSTNSLVKMEDASRLLKIIRR